MDLFRDPTKNTQELRIWRLWGSVGPFFDDDLKTGTCQKLRSSMLIDIAQVDRNFNFPKKRKGLASMFKASGHIKMF